MYQVEKLNRSTVEWFYYSKSLFNITLKKEKNEIANDHKNLLLFAFCFLLCIKKRATPIEATLYLIKRILFSSTFAYY